MRLTVVIRLTHYPPGLLSLRGTNLRTDISIPFTKYRPASTNVSFRIEGPDVAVGLTLPKWNTRSLYSRPHWYSDVGHIGLLHVDVSYCYHGDVHVENVDQLRVDITVSDFWSIANIAYTVSHQARDVVYKMCGWTIRHFMIMRNNYFGAFTHFSTLYEYLARRRLGLPLGDPVDLQYREGSVRYISLLTSERSINVYLVQLLASPSWSLD